ncbi:MAG: hypothetical protein MUE69_03605 [Myxococcota bacterium]|nr:hypothetical protein [Myxococcota bacterium]
MLRIGDDWAFPIDDEASRLWLSPKGTWGLELVCRETAVKTDDGLGASFAPRLAIKDLEFDGLDWRELVGLEVYQHGAWQGEGDPAAVLFVVEDGDLSETKLRITGHRGSELAVELETLADVFFDDSHDKEVPVRFQGFLRFSGVRFRFKAEGAATRDPGRRASELLSVHLAPQAFGPPEVTKVSAGLYEAFFPPALEDAEPPTRELDLADLKGASGSAPVSAEVNVLRQSARELLDAMREARHHDRGVRRRARRGRARRQARGARERVADGSRRGRRSARARRRARAGARQVLVRTPCDACRVLANERDARDDRRFVG